MVATLDTDSALTVEKFINILEAERKSYSTEFVPLHATKLDRIRKCVELTAQARNSIRRNVSKKRAHIILTDLWTSLPEVFVLCASAIFQIKLGSLKADNYLGKILEWWKEVEHPEGLTTTLQRLDALDVLRHDKGTQDGLAGLQSSLNSQTPALDSSTLSMREKDPTTRDQLGSQTALPSPTGTTLRTKEDGSRIQADQRLEEAGQQFWEGSGIQGDTQSLKRRRISQNDPLEHENLYSNNALNAAATDMAWFGRFDSLAAPAELPGMSLPPDQVFSFLSQRFAKWEVTLQSNASPPYIDIKQGPFSYSHTRIILDWETSNDLLRDIKTRIP